MGATEKGTKSVGWRVLDSQVQPVAKGTSSVAYLHTSISREQCQAIGTALANIESDSSPHRTPLTPCKPFGFSHAIGTGFTNHRSELGAASGTPAEEIQPQLPSRRDCASFKHILKNSTRTDSAPGGPRPQVLELDLTEEELRLSLVQLANVKIFGHTSFRPGQE